MKNNFKVGDWVTPIRSMHILKKGHSYCVLKVVGNEVLVKDGCREEDVWVDYINLSFEPGADQVQNILDLATQGMEKKEQPAVVQDSKTGANKRRFSLLPTEALRATIDVFESGNIDLPWRKAYPVDSWRKHGGDIKGAALKYIDALMRHLLDLRLAIETDNNTGLFTEDTGCYTAAAIAFGGLALTQFSIELTGKKPSSDGKAEIKRLMNGEKAYGGDV